MKKLTDLELKVMKAFIEESISCCGSFEDAENMSYMNPEDIQKATLLKKHTVAGLMGSLCNKGLIYDYGDSARGCINNDWVASPEHCAEYPQLAKLLTDNY